MGARLWTSGCLVSPGGAAALAAHFADLHPEFDVARVDLQSTGGGGSYPGMAVFRSEPAKREHDRVAKIWSDSGVVDHSVHCYCP